MVPAIGRQIIITSGKYKDCKGTITYGAKNYWEVYLLKERKFIKIRRKRS